jgi:hypothetical protein
MKKIKSYIILAFALFFVACSNDDGSFNNLLYLDTKSVVDEILLKGGIDEITQELQASIAKPENKDINISYKVDASLVDFYNEAYYDNAELLPDSCYQLKSTSAKIPMGSVKSNIVEVAFTKLSKLDREKVFVCPVTISEANIDLLKSTKTLYYLFKAGALINVVADITENYASITWKNKDVCNNLKQFTLEALIRARNFDNGLISTVMGIEGYFLLRIGDAGFPRNQLQVATTSGNFPPGDDKKGLPKNEWVHLAVTYDSVTKELIIYANGKKQSEGIKDLGEVSLGKDNFYIGKSWDDNRWLDGEISECRIWNVVRTVDQIEKNPYTVDPASEGLVAYWKFNDADGVVIKDHTVNGNDAVANKPLEWIPVSIPEN